MKHRNYDTFDIRGRPSRFSVPCEQREVLKTKKPFKSQNHETKKRRNYNTYYKHLKPNTMNAMKP